MGKLNKYFGIMLLAFAFFVLFANFASSDSVANTTNQSNSSVDNSSIIDNIPPSLIINSPSEERIDSLNPKISISVNDSNLGTCWYNVTQASNTNIIPIPSTQIPDCKETTMPSGALSYSVKYKLSVFVNDTYGNNNTASIEFTTPEPAKTEINNVNQNVNSNENNVNTKITTNTVSNSSSSSGGSDGLSFIQKIIEFFKNLFGIK